jgi:ferredoxin
MQINLELCVGCGTCAPYCPVGAISVERSDKTAHIDRDECVECGNCLRQAKCAQDAIYSDPLQWPRTVRAIFSDPLTITEEAGIAGRGTEEMKTNDVTGRFRLGHVGVGIEMGRPILGARFRDIETVAMAVATLGVEFEPCNPLTSLLTDPSTGKFPDDLLDEKVLSAIIEFSVVLEKLPAVLDVLKDAAGKIDSVFSLCIASRVDPDGSISTTPIFKEKNIIPAPNGKTNVGLGRPLFKEA